MNPDSMNFAQLISAIQQVHHHLKNRAGRAVNLSLTFRNWIIGLYITEYEQNGEDRAKYGAKLLATLSKSLQDAQVSSCEVRELRRYRQFYQMYPQIRESVTPELPTNMKLAIDNVIRESANPELELRGQQLVSKLSYTHFVELMKCDNPTKRVFYEIEAIKGAWSVRELKRQIGSLYYERSGLSLDKEKLSQLTLATSERLDHSAIIKDPYVFEFLGLRAREVMGESHLEDTLIDKLQEFLLELGHGFCFEARQKRILMGDEYFFADLVFYHRILKCHVLVELKLEALNHEHIGQLNSYVSWYKQHMMLESDNPPIGILLCSDKNHALAEYALAGMDNQLFASKYLLELPKKEEMQEFIEAQIMKLSPTESTPNERE